MELRLPPSWNIFCSRHRHHFSPLPPSRERETKCHSPPTHSVINASFAIHVAKRRRRNEPAQKFSPPPPPFFSCVVKLSSSVWYVFIVILCSATYAADALPSIEQWLATNINCHKWKLWEKGAKSGVQVSERHLCTKWQVLHELRANHRRNGFIH